MANLRLDIANAYNKRVEQRKKKEEEEIPSLKPASTLSDSDKKIISTYESLPDYNAFQSVADYMIERINPTYDKGDQRKTDFNKKQSMVNEYNAAKERQITSALDNYQAKDSNTIPMLAGSGANAVLHPFQYDAARKEIEPYLKENGITFDQLENYYRTQALREQNKSMAENASDNPIKNTLASFATNQIGNAETAIDALAARLSGKPIGENTAVNEYAQLTGAIRGDITKDIKDNASNKVAGDIGAGAYNLVTGLGDMGMSMALTGFNPSGSLALMSTNAGANTLAEQKEKDTTTTQKIATAVMSGAIEALTEKIPLDNLFRLANNPAGKQTAKQIFFNVLGQMASEGSEEVVSEIANNVVDNFFNEKESNYQQRIANYVAQGMSQDEATRMAMNDVKNDAIYAGVIGALSGGVMAGGASVINNRNANANGNSRQDVTSLEDPLGLLNNEQYSLPQLRNGNDWIQERQGVQDFTATSNLFPELRNVNDLMVNNRLGLDEAMQGYNPSGRGALRDINGNRINESTIPWTEQVNFLGRNLDENNIERVANERGWETEWGGEQEFAPNKTNVSDADLQELYDQANFFVAQYKATGNPVFLGTAESVAQRINAINRQNQAQVPALDTESEWDNDIFTNQNTQQTRQSIPEVEQNVTATEEQQSVPTLETAENQELAELENKYRMFMNQYQQNNDQIALKVAEAIQLRINKLTGNNQQVPSVNQQQNASRPAESVATTNATQNTVPSLNQQPVAEDNSFKRMTPSITSRNTYKRSPQFSSEKAQEFLAKEKAKGTYDVDVVKESESIEKAESRLNANPEEEIQRIENDKTLDGYQVDESMILLDQKIEEAERTGDWSEVRRFSSMVNQKIHKMAQGLQALAKYTRSAPAAIMKTEQIVRSLTGEDANFSDEDLAQVDKIFKEAEKLGESSKARMEKEQEAYKILAKYIPDTTFMDKWNAWRYLAMLGNTRTHIRNIIGNFMFGTVTNVKDMVAGTLESAFAKEGERTKSAFNKANPELLKAAKADAENVWQDLTDSGTSKYSMKNEIENERTVFKNKWLEGIRKFNENMLTKEDNFALVNKYKRALAGYLQANGADASIFNSTNEADQKLLKQAREYAIKEAKIATFHEENQLADMLNRLSKEALAKDSTAGQKALGLLIEQMVPFKKTPINILKQGAIAYNPLQIVHGLYDAVANGNNPSKWIDELSRGLTGTGIMTLGYWLASMGALKPSQKDEDDLDKLTGEQGYSINVKDNSYTIDWAAPAALPLFVGAELARAYKDRDNFDFWSALSSLSDPMVEMSMIQGLKNNIESIASFTSGKNTLGDAVINSGFGYASQGVPTLGGQVARSVDDTRRSSYTGQQGTADTIMRNVKKVQNKIPGLSMLNQPYVDAWGQTQENTGGNLVGRLAYNMLSPGYYSDTSKDSTEQELYRLTDKMKSGEIENKSIVPTVAGKTYNKERLSPSDYTKISMEKGQTTQRLYEQAMNNVNYAEMSDADKADLLNNLQKFSNALSKSEVFDYDIADSDAYKKKYQAYEYKGADGLVDYYALTNKIKESYKADNRNNPNKADRVKALDSMTNMSDEDKIAYLKILDDYTKKGQYVDKFLGEKYAYDWYKVEATGTKKDERMFAIYTMNVPDLEKQMLLSVLDMKDDDVLFHLTTGK